MTQRMGGNRHLYVNTGLRLATFFLGLLFAGTNVDATTIAAPSFEGLVGQADYIVRAVVKSVNAEFRTDGGQRHIITRVELEVREVISGNPPQPLILQMLGGKVGEEEMRVEGSPRFRVGDEDILFVRGNGRRMNPLVALMYGRYPIKHDARSGREYVTRSNGAPLHSETEISRPINGDGRMAAGEAEGQSPVLSPLDFSSRIKAADAQRKSDTP